MGFHQFIRLGSYSIPDSLDRITLMNNPKETAPLNPPAKPESLSAHAIKADYSMEEIQKMLGDIDSLVNSYKAEQEGIDPENMVKTIRGGRVVWITVEEMNTVLAKQRQINKSKIVQRSIRGENNLTSEIHKRIEACRSLISAIRKVAPKESADFSSRMRNLESLQNITTSQARDLYVLENAIQRKRQEDPLIREIDNATTGILDSLQKNQLADVDVSQSFCDRHMEEYLAKQKRLEPYLKKAADCRLVLLQNKQQLYQFQFELIGLGLETLSKFLDDIFYYDKGKERSPELIKFHNEIRDLLDSAQPSVQQLSDCPVEKLQSEEHLFHETDTKYLTPLFTLMVRFVECFQDAWEELVIKKEAIVTPEKAKEKEDKRTSIRMVYQELQGKNP